MKAQELRDLSVDELTRKIEELKGAAMKLRFRHATAQLDSTAEIRNTRRAIARAMTVLTQRQKASTK
ncbi:MAG: 50S ribosomal protein L29 [Nitrospinae bacterium]|nr:50S ribosomal protein L29 [Nitrospinota bacterium]